MKATVVKQYHDREKKETLAVKSDWHGTKERFEQINSHKSGPFLEAVEAEGKEAKTTRTTKERKVKTETK